MNIDCDLILDNRDFDDNNFSINDQKSIILKEIENIFGHIYKGGQTTLITDYLFILTNIRVNEQMDV